jgi:hypothetical protein
VRLCAFPQEGQFWEGPLLLEPPKALVFPRTGNRGGHWCNQTGTWGLSPLSYPHYPSGGQRRDVCPQGVPGLPRPQDQPLLYTMRGTEPGML